MKKILIKGLILIIILSLPQLGVSMSFFSDTVTVSGNTFTAGVWIPSKPGGLTIYRGHDPSTRVKIGCGALTNDTHITIEWNQNPETDIDYYWFGTKFNPKHKKVMFPNHEYRANMTPGHNPYHYTVMAVNKDGYESTISDQCGLILDQAIPQTTKGVSNTSEGDPATSPPETTEIVINEILPNPSSGQEWVELYNRSDTTVDLASWKVSELSDPQTTPSENFYDISSLTTNTGLKTIPAHDWLVIYFISGDILEDNGDTVALYNDLDVLQDEHTYSETVPLDKSIARYPDGANTWYDPVPTPGGPNKLEMEETEEVIGEDGESVDEDLGEPPVSEPSAEPSNEDVSEPQAPADPPEAEGEDEDVPDEEDGQPQPNENEQEAVIEETGDEVQEGSGDEPVSDLEPETSEPQVEDPEQTGENNETPTE